MNIVESYRKTKESTEEKNTQKQNQPTLTLTHLQ